MSERERFEAWHGGRYLGHQQEIAWAAWQAALARSGQAASGSQENARSDVQNGGGQPEAPTAAPLASLRELVTLEADGMHASESAIEAWERARAVVAAHPPARSGAGSEEAQPDRSEGS